MLEPLFQFVEKFVTDFSWKRLAIFFSFLGLVVLTFILYEWQTASNELNRYERATSILLQIEPLLDSKNSVVVETSKELVANLKLVIKQKDIFSSLEVSINPIISQIFFGLLPWIIIVIILIPSEIVKDKREAMNMIGGFFILLLFLGILISFIPIEWNNWLRYGGVQLFNLILIILLSWVGNKS
ncbi:hypothetical protein Abu_1326 [Aliarcobacter butzleri RM4018]|uniref:Uncharacterized protein n=1 Tax=Aliarcobacter butzleri (strain RM4018) TaxID=367737 RepID=A8EUF8_ALIB4|nr:hypothetical protein [Aliarcobacter butzleri]ABV67582.1 hypothetical protein Abu_1326 [Aliarcobacter butzleri RM4018]GGT74687.1 hypothetical protein GCM10007985_08240 [Aliarcobacter butzleri]SNV29403.1 Uncharacterised protein [Aliarcobacter butzleri]